MNITIKKRAPFVIAAFFLIDKDKSQFLAQLHSHPYHPQIRFTSSPMYATPLYKSFINSPRMLYIFTSASHSSLQYSFYSISKTPLGKSRHIRKFFRNDNPNLDKPEPKRKISVSASLG